jgi:Pyruvate/2-oxoacid:ferredoxin oxidoreductase delta subunit
MAAVWLDVTRCTGCGACVEVCPTGALTLVEGKARLDDALCKGCEVCIQACPVDALRPVLEIEAVPLAEHVPDNAPSSVPASPSVGLLATVVAAGAQLAVQAAPLILQTLGQLLLRPRGMSTGLGRALTSTSRLLSGRRQIRYRQRGRR